MRRTFVTLVLAFMLAGCDASALGFAARDGGADARPDALGPLPVIFSDAEDTETEGSNDAVYSLNR